MAKKLSNAELYFSTASGLDGDPTDDTYTQCSNVKSITGPGNTKDDIDALSALKGSGYVQQLKERVEIKCGPRLRNVARPWTFQRKRQHRLGLAQCGGGFVETCLRGLMRLMRRDIASGQNRLPVPDGPGQFQRRFRLRHSGFCPFDILRATAVFKH